MQLELLLATTPFDFNIGAPIELFAGPTKICVPQCYPTTPTGVACIYAQCRDISWEVEAMRLQAFADQLQLCPIVQCSRCLLLPATKCGQRPQAVAEAAQHFSCHRLQSLDAPNCTFMWGVGWSCDIGFIRRQCNDYRCNAPNACHHMPLYKTDT